MWQDRGDICAVRLRFPDKLVGGLVCGEGGGLCRNRFANRQYFFFLLLFFR
jgi:hypothetical protein